MSMQVLTLEQVCANATAPHFCPDSSGLFAVLQNFSTSLQRAQSLQTLLPLLTALPTQLIQLDFCSLLLADESCPHILHVAHCTPDVCSQAVVMQAVHNETPLLQQVCTNMANAQLLTLRKQESEGINPFKNIEFETLLPIPLVAGGICVGMLNCYSSRQNIVHSDEERVVLCTLASQAALAIKHLRVQYRESQERQQRIEDFVAALLSHNAINDTSLQRRAHFLHYDLQAPHFVVRIEVEQVQREHQSVLKSEAQNTYLQVLTHIKALLQEHYPGSLVALSDTGLLCLLCPARQTTDQVREQLQQLADKVLVEQHTAIAIGISDPCSTIVEYHRAATEAREALEIGCCLSGTCSCKSFDGLGVYRYIYPFTQANTLSDGYQRQIAALADYDRHKKTHLLDTLEAYLECGTNSTKTAEHLAVHRNTLIQRLERLQTLCHFDLNASEHGLPLLLALKLYRLQARHIAQIVPRSEQ